MAEKKTRKRFIRRNLVVMTFADNSCYQKVVSLRKAPAGLTIDCQAGTWSFFGATLRIGDHCGSRFKDMHSVPAMA